MFINGQSYAVASIEDTLSAVTKLETGFRTRTIKRTDDEHYLKSDACRAANEGEELIRAWQNSKLSILLSNAQSCYNRAIESAEQTDDHLIQAITYARYAGNASLFGVEEENIILLLSRAVKLCRDCGAKDFASQYSSMFHARVYGVIRKSIQQGVSNEIINPWLEALSDIRRSIAALFRNQRGEAVDMEAHRVEQGEIGYSNRLRFGTDFLSQCISPIIHNPETKMTALAHIDHGVDLNTLDNALRKLGYQSSGSPLLVRLVGGFCESDGKRLDPVSVHNAKRLVEYLQKRNVTIVSSDILQDSQPSCVVVDPVEFSLNEAIPGKENPDYFISQGRALLSGLEKPLYECFDLSRSTERHPVFINQKLSQVLSDLVGAPIADLYDIYAKTGEMDNPPLAEQVEGTKRLIDEFRSVVENAIGELSERVDELRIQGYGFDQEGLKKMVKVAAELPVYVGTKSDLANQRLLSFLRHDFIQVVNNGEAVWVNAAGLKKFYQAPPDQGWVAP